MTDNFSRAASGLVAALPACTIVAAGLLGLNAPAAFDSPLIVLGGLAVAVAFNLPPVLHLRLRRGPGYLVGAAVVWTEGTLLNLAVLAVSLTALGAIGLYFVCENLL
jgi:hypothetical protein